MFAFAQFAVKMEVFFLIKLSSAAPSGQRRVTKSPPDFFPMILCVLPLLENLAGFEVTVRAQSGVKSALLWTVS